MCVYTHAFLSMPIRLFTVKGVICVILVEVDVKIFFLVLISIEIAVFIYILCDESFIKRAFLSYIVECILAGCLTVLIIFFVSLLKVNLVLVSVENLDIKTERLEFLEQNLENGIGVADTKRDSDEP